MFVCILRIELHFPTAGSLKSKRAELRPLKAGLQQRLHVAVSEVDHHDTWQRAALGCALVARTASDADAAADRVVRWLDAQCPAGVRVDRVLTSWADLGEEVRVG